MIKLPTIHLGKLSMLLALLVWLILLFVDMVRLFGILNELDSGIATELTLVLEVLFFLSVYFFYNYSIQKNAQKDFINLIWRAASTGIFSVGIFLLIGILYQILGQSKLSQEPFLLNFFYHVKFAFVSIFLISSALLWKHLILYQKSKQVVKQWQAFEFAMLISMFFIFFNKNNLDYSFLFGLVILLGIGLVLASNLKWIPYLTFKEKWKSLLFLALIISSLIYLFTKTLEFSNPNFYPVNLTDNLFLISLFGFILIYAIISFLVTLFNLPTSSVFEQKLTEAISFQRLSQSIQPGENEDQVLDILIDSCMSTSFADAAWLEMTSSESRSFVQERMIDPTTRSEISALVSKQKNLPNWTADGNVENFIPVSIRLKHPKFRSVLLVPLILNKTIIGKMVLCKEVKDGFNKEMINIITTFARQASIAVENHRLLNQAILSERYQEELKIAQRVQKALLPTRLDHNESFDICAYSNAADEVGGDYYDTFKLDEDRFVLIIGDVSGKGTSAAFHMAQMKGIFQSLIQLDLSPSDFMIKANSALGKCLEKNHFITASIFVIDTQSRKIRHARAGHVPTLYFDTKTKKSNYLEINGLGLGILRNKQYENHVEEMTYDYLPGDILVLFTDGIVEAQNEKSIQFGFENIKNLVETNSHQKPREIQTIIIDSLHAFVGGDGMIDDDYSLMVVKFNDSPSN
jgi:serine phosphatase RsbU (regulator of sigma subunit)